MILLKLILKNCLRHRLRATLTALGVCVALLAFSLIRTLLVAWYSGVEASAKDRLITRNAISLIFSLPISYAGQIAKVPGITRLGYGSWFGGKYGDGRYLFQQFAMGGDFLELYPEIKITTEERESFLRDRKGVIVGEDAAKKLNLKVDDVIQLQGTIYPGIWEFNVRSIFRRIGKEDTRVMYFHWEYLNEKMRQENNEQADHVGFFGIQLVSGADAAEVSKRIDKLFANSYAETLTETETAFIQGFISMSSTIILALKFISIIVIIIILLVLTNTMLMSLRERYREYAILKALGFDKWKLSFIIIGESFTICLIGLILLFFCFLGIFLPPPQKILGPLYDFFPVFELRASTVLWSCFSIVLLALFAGIIPAWTVSRAKVTDCLRRLG